MALSSDLQSKKGRPPRGARGDTGLVREIAAAVSTDEVAARVLVTACATLAVGWLGLKEAVGAVVASQIFSEAVKRAVERARLSARKTWAAVLLLLLFNLAQRAFAAVRRGLLGPGRDTPRRSGLPYRSGLRASAVATATVTVLAVGTITALELAVGHSLVSERRTTLFSADRVPADRPTPPGTTPSTIPTNPTVPTVTERPPPTGTGPVTTGPEPPQLHLPRTEPRAEATGPHGSRVSFDVTADEGRVSCSPASGSLFAIGTTRVRCTATAGDRRASASFDVAVVDETAPRLTLPRSIERQLGEGRSTITYRVSALDVVDGPLSPSCSPASGASFLLGTTRVRCSTVDAHGNRASGSFPVRLTQAPPGVPELRLPGTIVLEATGPDGAAATYAVSAAASGEETAVSCSQASGSIFRVGTTRVTCTATAGGAEARGSFDVVVRDTTRPELTLPEVDPVEAVAREGTALTFRTEARDLVDGELTPSCSAASGAVFPIGTTTVDCTVSDAAGNASRGSFSVTVFDGPPQIDPPAPIVVDYTSTRGTKVTYAVTARDRVDGALTPTCTRPSGSSFAIGTTSVKCTAVDSAGQDSSADFTVTVRDRVAPQLTLPTDIVATAPVGAKSRLVSFDTSAWDAVDKAVPIACTPRSGSSFPIGTTTVSCRATDKSGNTRTGRFTVTVNEPVDLR